MQTHLFYGSAPHLEITKNRRNGYLDAMKKYHIPVDDSMIKLCDTRERAIAITPDLLESEERPDGFSPSTMKRLPEFFMPANW